MQFFILEIFKSVLLTQSNVPRGTLNIFLTLTLTIINIYY